MRVLALEGTKSQRDAVIVAASSWINLKVAHIPPQKLFFRYSYFIIMHPMWNKVNDK